MGVNLATLPFLAMDTHPLRTGLYQELHNRPFPIITANRRITHIALLTQQISALEERAHLRELAHRYSVNSPEDHASCYYQDFGEFEVRWERHTEFSTYTFITSASPDHHFEETALSLLPQSWLESLPGSLLVGVHVLVKDTPNQDTTRDELKQYFEGQRLIGSHTDDNQATVWTAFRLHSDDFSRVLLFNRGLNGCQLGRLVQRVLEIEAYRVMALLAVPAARELGDVVNRMDMELANILKQLAENSDADGERRLLKYLTALAAEVEKYRADTNYRFAATHAYYELVVQRLSYFERQDLSGIQSIPEFLERRLTPAIRTCNAIQQRLEDLSRRIGRAGELLNTKVDLSLKEQNQRLLASMNKRSKMQLRLQQTVEGLSVVAISYYLVGLIKYLAALSTPIWPGINKDYLVAGSVPLVIAGVWWMTHRIRRTLVKPAQQPKTKNT